MLDQVVVEDDGSSFGKESHLRRAVRRGLGPGNDLEDEGTVGERALGLSKRNAAVPART